MSAQIVTEFSRDAYDPARLFPNGVAGDVLKRIRPGQLWERVAEIEASGINYTERMERIKIDRIRRAHGYDAQATGEYVKVAHSTRRSGIIRAGVRVK